MKQIIGFAFRFVKLFCLSMIDFFHILLRQYILFCIDVARLLPIGIKGSGKRDKSSWRGEAAHCLWLLAQPCPAGWYRS